MSGHTYTESAEATVTRVDDPEELGRIKVKCEAIAGDDEEIDEWIPPLFPLSGDGMSWFVIPEPGDTVEIEYVTGSTLDSSYGQSFLSNPRFRWKAGVNRDKDDVPEEFRGAKYGKRVGMTAGKGRKNMIAFDKDKDEAIIKGRKKTRVGSLDGGQAAVVGEDLVFWQTKMIEDAIERQKDQSVSWKGIREAFETYMTTLNTWVVASGGPDQTAVINLLLVRMEVLEEAYWGDPEDYVASLEESLEDVTDHLSSSVTIAKSTDEEV